MICICGGIDVVWDGQQWQTCLACLLPNYDLSFIPRPWRSTNKNFRNLFMHYNMLLPNSGEIPDIFKVSVVFLEPGQIL